MSASRVLICGSLAFDTIMVFRDRFARHILPDQTHTLSVSFQIGDMRREWGGCAGNIAYNLQAIGGEPVVMATVGDDGDAYRDRLHGSGIGVDAVRIIPGAYTAQAFIITDLDDNQITAFHPGAMNQSHQNHVSDVQGIRLGIVAPDGRDGMLAHVTEFSNAGIPFIFDPGQGLPLFSGDELLSLIDAATYVAVNDYEAKLLSERTGLSLEVMAQRVKGLVVTLGASGSRIYAGSVVHEIPAVAPTAIIDPTGCGDAYRAGLLYGIANDWEWPRTGRLAAILGAEKIASRGGQNHQLSRERLEALYRSNFNQPLW